VKFLFSNNGAKINDLEILLGCDQAKKLARVFVSHKQASRPKVAA
jgi:hypothetical protein